MIKPLLQVNPSIDIEENMIKPSIDIEDGDEDSSADDHRRLLPCLRSMSGLLMANGYALPVPQFFSDHVNLGFLPCGYHQLPSLQIQRSRKTMKNVQYVFFFLHKCI